MTNSKFWFVGIGLLVNTGILAFYLQSRSTELEIGRIEQIDRAELVRKQIDKFVVMSNLLSRFIQEDISGKKLDIIEVENNLQQYLRASPANIVFGIGIWYEPFQFKKNKKLFGPYVHRPSSIIQDHENILTYEWNTEKYNYPAQNWYKSGLANSGESFFVNPYFDNGLVYVTNSRAFYNKEKKLAGVISVDLVLPQLQDIISQANQSNEEMIYVTNQEGMLLAHPLKTQFFKIKNIVDGKNNQSLLNYRARDLKSVLNLNQEDWIQSELIQEQLGWKVIITSSKKKLLDNGLLHLGHLLIAISIALWLMILIVWKVLELLAKEKKENEKKIEISRMQLIQSSKMAALGEMASGIAHEINNPLTVIIGKVHQINLQFEKTHYENEEVSLKLKQITSTAERIAHIIVGLRTFSRSGEQDALQPEYLSNIVTDTIALCTERFKYNSIPLEVAQVPVVKIQCRPPQLSQVILNLLLNSFDAVEKLQEKWVRINFQLDINKGEIKIEIIDSGNGILPEIAKHIMEPFFTTKEVGKGTGLGLSISKGIIEGHHGKLELDEASINTKFVITLPVLLD